jgi:hypothetical protein
MNKENAHQYLPLVQALADGKMIQIRMNAGWMDVAYAVDIRWDLPPESYRIKPEPREWNMVVGNDGKLYQPELCRAFAQSLTIRVREIVD